MIRLFLCRHPEFLCRHPELDSGSRCYKNTPSSPGAFYAVILNLIQDLVVIIMVEIPYQVRDDIYLYPFGILLGLLGLL